VGKNRWKIRRLPACIVIGLFGIAGIFSQPTISSGVTLLEDLDLFLVTHFF
jgi:hypothetical protein